MQNWERKKREKLVNSKFLEVYKDTLINKKSGTILEYFLTKKNDVVIIVPTTKGGDLIYIKQFVYAIEKKINCLPAGHIEKGESPIDTAKRELLEETGCIGESYEYITKIHEYPTQDLHSVHIVHAKNVIKKDIQKLEEAECIDVYKKPFHEVFQDVINGGKNWISAGPIIALMLVYSKTQ